MSQRGSKLEAGVTDEVQFSAEDKLAVINGDSPNSLFPHQFLFSALGSAARELQSEWALTWDFRRIGERLYEDVRWAYEEAEEAFETPNYILTSPDNRDLIADVTRNRKKLITMTERPLVRHPYNLDIYSDEASLELIDYARIDALRGSSYIETAVELGISDITEAELYRLQLREVDEGLFEASAGYPNDLVALHDEMTHARADHLKAFLSGIAANSLLMEILVQADSEKIHIIPYHSFSIHHLETPRGVTLIRPGRKNASYWKTFQSAIAKLEYYLADPQVTEHQIDMLLRENPLFLQGINYRHAYSQVVLPIPGGDDSLRPDFIAEPFDSEWADIVELKLPSADILVGREHRASLAATLHSTAAQLREYSAYFDDRRIARHVEDKYGFRCYHPRLVAIVGRDPMRFSEEAKRRALTAYPDLRVVTYDQLVRAAKSRLALL